MIDQFTIDGMNDRQRQNLLNLTGYPAPAGSGQAHEFTLTCSLAYLLLADAVSSTDGLALQPQYDATASQSLINSE